MTEQEQYALLKELDGLLGWMRESAPRFNVKEYKSLEEQIQSLEKDSGDFYEVFIEIHLSNGRYITIRNYAFETMVRDNYMGDDLDVNVDERKEMIPVVEVLYKDPETGFTQTKIPISSICYVSGYTKEIKWKERWDAMDRAKKDDCIAAFDHWYTKNQQEK
nr:MAG TPA: hypothetical protein [Caudoviricetes sp.]